MGVGGALLEAMRDHAHALGAPCLWVETQNVNAPAIRFYRRHGFACCGLDTTLYDPRQLRGETAVFLALALGPHP
jgi:ribosomal protein S18 acetylase RimI-like enzyme